MRAWILILLLLVVLAACQSNMEKAVEKSHEAVQTWKTTAPLLRR